MLFHLRNLKIMCAVIIGEQNKRRKLMGVDKEESRVNSMFR